MNKNVFERFINEEKYLQNPPLETKRFIKYCKKRGINTNEKELELFEKEKLLFPIIRIKRPILQEEWIKFEDAKDGEIKRKMAVDGLKNGEKEIERYSEQFYSDYGFGEFSKRYLPNWLENGLLFDPSKRKFKEWSTFKGKQLKGSNQQIVNFYSSFQIDWLYTLKKYYLERYLDLKNNPNNKHNELFLNNLSYNKRKYNEILRFLLLIQNVYYPFGRKDSKGIQINANIGGSLNDWHNKIFAFDPKKELNFLHLSIENVTSWYQYFSNQSLNILDIKKNDWIQIWINVDWGKKDKLEGKIRLGIEYLQWALMLKKIIEDFKGKEILDIDEIHNISSEKVLVYDPSKMFDGSFSKRIFRNKRNFDPEEKKNYYENQYKKLFYLANEFKLDYQPRIMVFVEGKTEETILPKVFEWYYNFKPENMGIEFINFQGVDLLLSTSKNAEDLRNLINDIEREIKAKGISKTKRTKLNRIITQIKKTDIIISNWSSFLSYNLEKWQTIPFFLSDNEGNVKHFLDAEKPINFKNKSYNVPNHWKYLWGSANKNKPYIGNNFEFANFSDNEIRIAINEILKETVDNELIKNIRNDGKGINKIDDKIDAPGNKIKIVNKLFESLFEKYKKYKYKSILKRPIFKVIDQLINISSLNHMPTDRLHEIENKKIIERELRETL